ncbi:MAG: glycosyltransferase [Thermodesulfobacteriota bacterium]
MIRRGPLKLIFYLNLVVLTAVLGYKIYLNISAPEFNVIHSEQIERIDAEVSHSEDFSFAVLGNIKNSVGIFEQRIIPMLNEKDLDFVVSAGNAVSGGGEDKYRAIHGTLQRLDVPYLLTFGPNEYEDFGSFRFYDYFGPHFFSIKIADNRFVFLDSTGKTPWKWQMRWLEDLLEPDRSDNRFIFISHPPLKPSFKVPFDTEDDYLHPDAFRSALLSISRKYSIDMVFSTNLSLYAENKRDPTTFITTGGAGGLVLNNDHSFYHFVRVDVPATGKASYSIERLEVRQHPLLKQLESLWFFIYSFLYTGYLNFILLVTLLSLVAIKLYNIVFTKREYYPDYDLDPSPLLEKSLNVAMFTNNYLPFIGGVPISIQRLSSALRNSGDHVIIVAPRYDTQSDDETDILRLSTLFKAGRKNEFRIANIFSLRIWNRLKRHKPDIIHIHHPFWLGSLGLFMARRLDIPAVYTYHTRLEEYAHFVPLPGALFRNLISHALIKRFANRCDCVIVPTYSTEEYLRIIGVKRPIEIQPTGIEYHRFQKYDEGKLSHLRSQFHMGDEQILVSVSRLSNEKNIDFMLDAIATIPTKTSVAFRLFIIGDGHEHQRLQQRLETMGLSEVVTLVGAVPPREIVYWYQVADMFVFTSRSETQGMVILEAMSAGLPVVAVRSSGIDDVVKDGVNGYKTPQRVEYWSDRVVELLEQDEKRTDLGENAREFAREYSVEHFAANVRQIYAQTLAQRAQK